MARRNIEELMLLENPYNPRRRRRARRNPLANPFAATATLKEWTQGVDMMDAAGALGGLAAATMIPGMIIKDTSTTGKKVMKLVVALGCAIGAGAIGRSVSSPSVGKAAVIGGVAGTAAQALGLFTSIKVGDKLALSSRRIGDTNVLSPRMTREGETVSIIQP